MANEKRLIDAERLKRILQNFEGKLLECGKTEGAEAVKTIIKGLKTEPTVDAVPVVHGRWLNWRGEPIMPDDYWRLWRCSVCNNEWEYPKAVDADEVSFHYCPNCGAKMDGDGNA